MSELKELLELRRDEVRPDPGAYRRLVSRHRRREVARRVGVVAVALALTLAGLVVAVRALGSTTRTPANKPSASPFALLPPAPESSVWGRWSTKLTNADAGVGPLRLAGSYRLIIRRDGSLELFLPRGRRFAGMGQPTRGTYSFTGGGFTITTNVLASRCGGSSGKYTWATHSGQIFFQPAGDSCPLRRRILSSGWISSP